MIKLTDITEHKKGVSSVLYNGPSLIDGSPIIVIATIKSGNSKTGDMVQTWILANNGETPIEASKSGADRAICGDCIHRGESHNDPKRKTAKNRSCYVTLMHGPLGVYKAFKRGVYPIASEQDSVNIGRDRMVRLGTYGDPAAVPSHVWDTLLSEAKGHTAYTHQSNIPTADTRSDLFMMSADSLNHAQNFWADNKRTFRVIADTTDVQNNEILCPASEEMGKLVTCEKCKLCAGSNIKAKNIAIVVHGQAGKKHFKTA
jgi:hypothetical protein